MGHLETILPFFGFESTSAFADWCTEADGTVVFATTSAIYSALSNGGGS